MNLGTLVRTLRVRAALRRHERGSRRDLEVHVASALRELRDHAVTSSAFYRQAHRGLELRPLHELPIVSKATLMERFDDVVTTLGVRLQDVERHLATCDDPSLFAGRYAAASTSGTTGRRGVFVWDPTEWATILASYARAQDWAGSGLRLTSPRRMAVVSSRSPWHQSAVVAWSASTAAIPTLRLDASEPLAVLATSLAQFQPEVLVGYASILRALAEEQLAGRLSIAPRAVMSASEVLTPASRARVREAFGVEPFDVYAATETAGIAAECEHHRKHLFEDLVVAEIVDASGHPVPVGTPGAQLLVTVLFSRTVPLIRYAMSDRLALDPEPCPCGRPFGVVRAVEGRADELLDLPATGGGRVLVHPLPLLDALEQLAVRGAQVTLQGGRILCNVEGERGTVSTSAVAVALRRALDRLGVGSVPVDVHVVDRLPRTGAGKLHRAGVDPP